MMIGGAVLIGVAFVQVRGAPKTTASVRVRNDDLDNDDDMDEDGVDEGLAREKSSRAGGRATKGLPKYMPKLDL